VRVGGRYRCHPIGVLEIDDVRKVTCAAITDEEARRSGFESRTALLAHIAELGPVDDDTELYRIELHHGGDGDRVESALVDQLAPADIEAITASLARLDRKTPWTAETLAIIDAQPRIAASKLAAQLGRETLPFKTDVRKLKRLGLTQSFEVGYEISPRGRAWMAAAGDFAPRAARGKTRRA